MKVFLSLIIAWGSCIAFADQAKTRKPSNDPCAEQISRVRLATEMNDAVTFSAALADKCQGLITEPYSKTVLKVALDLCDGKDKQIKFALALCHADAYDMAYLNN